MHGLNVNKLMIKLKNILNEQIYYNQPVKSDSTYVDNRFAQNMQIADRIRKIENRYSCVNPKFQIPTDALLKKGYNQVILKLALGIIGRESSFATGRRYATYGYAKEIAAKYLATDFSMGPAQMAPSTAADLGLSVDYIATNIGALDAAYKYLSRSIRKAKEQGYDATPSNLGNEGTGNAIYDISIASYNLGMKIIHKWCKTDNANIKRNCSDAGKLVEKYRVSNTQVKNYIPNFKTKRPDGTNTSTHGYVKEVAETYKNLKCVRIGI